MLYTNSIIQDGLYALNNKAKIEHKHSVNKELLTVSSQNREAEEICQNITKT